MRALTVDSLLYCAAAFRSSFIAAAIGGVVAATMKAYVNYSETNLLAGNLFEAQAYTSFSFLLALLFAFRTSQAYARFWEGATLAHQMVGDWFDAASSIMAFCAYSDSDAEEVKRFVHTIVRMFSLLNALILAELENSDDSNETRALAYDLLDVQGLDSRTLRAISRSDTKPECVFQKIQHLLVMNMKNGLLNIPPPVLTRVFQELGSGMLKYHELVKLVNVPFPVTYRVATEFLLSVHFCVTPIVMVMLTDTSAWAAMFTSAQIFVMCVLVSLSSVLDNPFKHASRDMDFEQLQLQANKRFARLLENYGDAPVTLSDTAVFDATVLLQTAGSASFSDADDLERTLSEKTSTKRSFHSVLKQMPHITKSSKPHALRTSTLVYLDDIPAHHIGNQGHERVEEEVHNGHNRVGSPDGERSEGGSTGSCSLKSGSTASRHVVGFVTIGGAAPLRSTSNDCSRPHSMLPGLELSPGHTLTEDF